MRPFLVRATVGALLATALAGAEEPARVEGGLAASAWRLERLTLTDGRTLEGLALDTADDDVGFIEVVRRPGRPMHLVARRLPAAGVRSVDRLPAAEHAALAARVEAFRTNSLEDREAVAAVRLTRRGEDGPWCYAGPLFDVESSAGQQLTRMAIVRLESLLDAFERLVPAAPAATGGRRLSVRLCGSQSEYAGVQAERGVSVANPAFYLPASSLLVAGGDVPAVIEQARRAADGLDATLQRQSDLDEEVTAGLRGLAEQLQAQGIPASRRAEIVALTRARRQREKAAVVAHVEQARRANDARVDLARGEFLRWLAHETWHAYADLRLGDRGGLPPWLDEGLAQVFEGGLLEAGELRLDAPDGERLARLASLLAARPDVTLLPLVTGGDRQFLVGHGTGPASSREAYLLAWGVAYDLALGSPVLSAQALAALAAPSAAPRADGVARFERLVRMPLADYTAGWRDRMLALARRPRRVTAPAPEGGPPAPATDAARPAVPGR